MESQCTSCMCKLESDVIYIDVVVHWKPVTGQDHPGELDPYPFPVHVGRICMPCLLTEMSAAVLAEGRADWEPLRPACGDSHDEDGEPKVCDVCNCELESGSMCAAIQVIPRTNEVEEIPHMPSFVSGQLCYRCTMTTGLRACSRTRALATPARLRDTLSELSALGALPDSWDDADTLFDDEEELLDFEDEYEDDDEEDEASAGDVLN